MNCVLVNGKSKEVVSILLTGTATAENNIFECLELAVNTRAQGEYQCVDVVMKNNSPVEQFIEVRIESAAVSDCSSTYWDGVSERKLNGNHVVACHGTPCDEGDVVLNDHLYPDCYDGLDPAGDEFAELMKGEFEGPNQFLVFPASAVYSEKGLVCIGIDPRYTLTYQASGLNPNYYHSSKRVILPGEQLTTRFVVFQCASHQGYRTVLNRYYRWFPECFSTNPEFDNAQYQSAATFRSYEADFGQKEFLREDFRRMHLKWIWNIEEFNEGKIVIDSEEEASSYSNSKGAECLRGMDLADILEQQREGNAALSGFARPCGGITFEHATKKNVFTYDLLDSAWIRSDNRIHLRRNLASRGGDLYLLFANNTSYMEHLKSQIDKSLSLGIQGFIFDNAGGPRMYFGPATKRCRSRAFINDQVYCTSAISHVGIMEYIKSLKNDRGNTYMLSANTPADYNLSRNVDITILEGGPWHDNYQWYRLQRHLMGKKSCVFWGPKGFPDWQQMADREMVAEAKSQVHCLLLCCFEMGYLPNSSHAVRGYPEMNRMMPLLSEICRAGWEPERAGELLRGNVSFEQFGEDFFSLVNFSTELEKVEVKFDLENKIVLPRTNNKITIERHSDHILVSFSLQARSFIVLQYGGEWHKGFVLNIEKNDDNIILGSPEGQASSLKLRETGTLSAIFTEDGWASLPQRIDFENDFIVKYSCENLLQISHDFFDKYLIDATCMPEISVYWNNHRCRDAEVAMEKYFAYYAAAYVDEQSSAAERIGFKAGNHDTKFVLRVVDRAGNIFNTAIRKTKLCIDIQCGNDNNKPFKRIIKEAGEQLIRYEISGPGQDFAVIMEELFNSLDKFFPVTGVQAIIERKHLRTKNHNLHVG